MYGYGRATPLPSTEAAPESAPTRRAVGFDDLDKTRLAAAFAAWAQAANRCPVCVTQAAHARMLAQGLLPDDPELPAKLALEYLRRAELQDAIALVCDGTDPETAIFAASELAEHGFDPNALVVLDSAPPADSSDS